MCRYFTGFIIVSLPLTREELNEMDLSDLQNIEYGKHLGILHTPKAFDIYPAYIKLRIDANEFKYIVHGNSLFDDSGILTSEKIYLVRLGPDRNIELRIGVTIKHYPDDERHDYSDPEISFGEIVEVHIEPLIS